VSGLADLARAAGFADVREHRPWPAFAIVHGHRGKAAA